MLFNSAEFLLLFLPLTLIAFYLALRLWGGSAPSNVLLVASLLFYSAWDARYLPLLLLSIGINYAIGRQLQRRPLRSHLIAGIAFNLGLIGYFKYANWFIDTINYSADQHYPLIALTLPLGISFFTFQQITFLVDSYKQTTTTLVSFGRYALFVSFFPQLIAGPIVRAQQLIPQFNQYHRHYAPAAEQIAKGILLIMVGLFKKIMIADTIAQYVDPAFANVEALSSYDAWVATIGYSFQLYFDFSAYCEMAMGFALLFGIQLPINFNSPYKARNIQDFWRRWHMTLGQFLRDYLYIPLGGNRKGVTRTVIAVVVTMGLGGLWHGAGWNFIVWGLMHGLFLGIYALWLQQNRQLPRGLAQALTLLAVMSAWTMFRCESVTDALTMYERMYSLQFSLPAGYQTLFPFLDQVFEFTASPYYTGAEIFFLAVLLAFVMNARNVHEIGVILQPNWRYTAAVGLAAFTVAFHLDTPTSFIYWQF